MPTVLQFKKNKDDQYPVPFLIVYVITSLTSRTFMKINLHRNAMFFGGGVGNN